MVFKRMTVANLNESHLRRIDETNEIEINQRLFVECMSTNLENYSAGLGRNLIVNIQCLHQHVHDVLIGCKAEKLSTTKILTRFELCSVDHIAQKYLKQRSQLHLTICARIEFTALYQKIPQRFKLL